MGQHYTSFLVRCWRLGGDQRRIRIQHVQSGAETQVSSLAAALAWLETCWQEVGSDSPGPEGAPPAGEAGP